jgi:hypothetical protein
MVVNDATILQVNPFANDRKCVSSNPVVVLAGSDVGAAVVVVDKEEDAVPALGLYPKSSVYGSLLPSFVVRACRYCEYDTPDPSTASSGGVDTCPPRFLAEPNSISMIFDDVS